MAISYAEAIQLVETEAQNQCDAVQRPVEACSISRTRGRIADRMVCSPISTPRFDTSAMDGYALSSVATHDAAVSSPQVFEVKGLTAAGDEPLSLEKSESSIPPCVEIMTGAPFPRGAEGAQLDCCVKVEDAVLTVDEFSNRRFIKITAPAKPQQNRRPAAADFKTDDVILRRGELIRSNHIMSLASVGITVVPVIPKPRVALFSTGAELVPPDDNRAHQHRISDTNGPYLTAVLEGWGAKVDFLGVMPDQTDVMEHALHDVLNERKYDLIITSGAVSAGRFDFVPVVLKRLRARLVFHKIAMRPGHPALFAMLSFRSDTETTSGKNLEETAFFGLPGNPVASAACLRLLVLPYLKPLQLQNPEMPYLARVLPVDDRVRTPEECSRAGCRSVVCKVPLDQDVFRPAIFWGCSQDDLTVALILDHSPSKVKPLLQSNCWMRIPGGVSELKEGDMVEIYPMC